MIIDNSIWGQIDYTFSDPFLDTLAEHYGACIELLDFINEPEDASRIINSWIRRATGGLIDDLIQPGAISPGVRLILTNAIYFKSDWKYRFKLSETRSDEFHSLDGLTVMTDMMNQKEYFRYGSGAGYQSIELPYKGESVSMIVILPDITNFVNFEDNLTSTVIDRVIDGMSEKEVYVTLPKYSITSELDLTESLNILGMIDAFDPVAADFSGITGLRDISITDISHKAVIRVDETGTVASSSTAIIGAGASPLMYEFFIADHPFIYLIRDMETGTILFMGRYINP